MAQKALNNDEYIKRISDLYNKEFTPISTYVNGRTDVKMKHKCGYEFDVKGKYSMTGNMKCPVCDCGSTNLNTEVIKKRIYNKCGDEFVLESEYINSKTPITLFHKKCGKHINVLFTNFERSKCGCKECSKELQIGVPKIVPKSLYDKRKSNFLSLVNEVNPDLEVIGDYIDNKTKVLVRCKLCNKEYKASPVTLRNGNGCIYCHNHVPSGVKHEKCLFFTHPYISELLVDKEYAYKYTFGTKQETDFVCPFCNNIIHTRPSVLFNENTGKIRCHKCGDGFSFPEKFMANVLEQLNIEYITQYSSKNASWIGKYRYDYYLPSYHMIIEVHGEQHYVNKNMFGTEIDQMEIDTIKRNLALQNGIKNYIEINASESSKTFLQNSIIDSLSSSFDLSEIDWDECSAYASNSNVINVCNDWNNGIEDIPKLAKKYHVNTVTIYSYLERGVECNICDFDKSKYIDSIKGNWYSKIASKRVKPVRCIETGVIYNSSNDAANIVNGKASSILRVANGKRKTAYGYHWELA